MSQIKIEANPSGGGIYTLQSGAGSTDRTITLPDKAGEVAVGAGTIVQVNSMVRTQSSFTTTSTSFVDVTDFNLSITPTSSSNKILCFVDALVRTTGGFHQNCRSSTNLVRGSTVINTKFTGQYIGNTDGNNLYIPTQIIYLDSPATTSSTTYKIQIKSENSAFTTSIHPNDIPSITLMEVVA